MIYVKAGRSSRGDDAQHATPDSHEIILAVTELRDAETNLRQAIRALPDDDASNASGKRKRLSIN